MKLFKISKANIFRSLKSFLLLLHPVALSRGSKKIEHKLRVEERAGNSLISKQVAGNGV